MNIKSNYDGFNVVSTFGFKPEDYREKDINRFYTIDEINPNLKIISDKFDEIQKEFLENKHKLFWTNWHGSTGYLGDRSAAYAGWKVAGLYAKIEDNADIPIRAYLDNLEFIESNMGVKLYPDLDSGICFTENSKILPKMTKLLQKIGITKRVAIGVVDPGKQIKWHIDPDPELDNNAIIRGLWGLDVNLEEGKDSYLGFGTPQYHIRNNFENNKVMLFYGRIPHCVVNNLSTPRYVIVFDQDVDKDYLVEISKK